MSTPEKQQANKGSKATPVPPAPNVGGGPASFAPKPTNVPAPSASDAVVVNGTGQISSKDVKLGAAQGKLSVEQPRGGVGSGSAGSGVGSAGGAGSGGTGSASGAGSAGGAGSVGANRAVRPGPRDAAAAPATIGARRVRLAVTRVDPWSAMKMSFLLSIAAGIMMVVAAVVFWKVLDGLHVFTEIDGMVKEILGAETDVNILQYVELSRVVSLTTIIAIVDIVLLTALGTIGAFLYNVVAALVGGIHLTLTDD